MFLRFEKYVMVFLTVCSFLAVIILIPVYSLGDAASTTMNSYTILNIKEENDLASAPVLMLLLFSLLAYLFTYKYIKAIKEWQNKPYQDGQETAACVLELYGLPSKAVIHELEAELRTQFKSVFREGFLDISVVPNATLAYEAQEERKHAIKIIEHYEKVVQEKGTLPLIRAGCCICKKQAALPYWEYRIKIASQKFQSDRALNEYKSSPVAFVFCKNEVSMEQMVTDIEKIEFK